ncbi:MAG TPA: 2OG-Fe(II) oxygenase [Candidatus Binatia bacterium]|nr:2OG-Fe(II) oxygenase [Candidatus Binatia bacterium]
MRSAGALTRLRDRLPDLATRRDRFAAAEPFPHAVIDDFLAEEDAEALVAEFARAGGDDGWTYYHHVNERKRGFPHLDRMSPAGRDVVLALQSPEFIAALERLTGVGPLLADPELDGGGLHETEPGGFLNVHTDFLSHTTRPRWSRQVNLLVFLNRGWQESWGGRCELWDGARWQAVQRILPVFNRCVIFRTSEISFHGSPEVVRCPPGSSRKSLALYYFRDEGAPCRLRPTRYVALPDDPPLRRALIHVDRWVLHAYSALKRYTPLGDRVASALLRRF